MLILANEAVCVGVFVLFGCGGFLILIAGLFFKTLKLIWNMLFGNEVVAEATMSLRCENADCGELNRVAARYCRRCGSTLRLLGGTTRRA